MNAEFMVLDVFMNDVESSPITLQRFKNHAALHSHPN